MITSVSSIYGKIFRLLSFEIEELAKVQGGQANPPCDPPLAPFAKFKFFFKPVAMLTVISPTNAESFIPFG